MSVVVIIEPWCDKVEITNFIQFCRITVFCQGQNKGKFLTRQSFTNLLKSLSPCVIMVNTNGDFDCLAL